MKTTKATPTPGAWTYSYTSAAKARKDATKEAKANGTTPTDGGGASGCIYAHTTTSRYPVTVAYLPHHRNETEDAQREANARLLAAAPELLDALRCLYNITTHPKATLASIRMIAAEARTAIAKATQG